MIKENRTTLIATIEHILTHRKLTLSTLSLLRSEVACCYLYDVFQTSTDGRKADAVWLIKHIAHPVCEAWIGDFLNDEITTFGVGLHRPTALERRNSV